MLRFFLLCKRGDAIIQHTAHRGTLGCKNSLDGRSGATMVATMRRRGAERGDDGGDDAVRSGARWSAGRQHDAVGVAQLVGQHRAHGAAMCMA
jgi:hypothetical protein